MADDQQMLRDHQQTWKGFTRLMVWSVVLVVAVLVFVAVMTL